MHALSLSHISFSWPDGRPVFADLSFALPPGVSGLVGRNGIGKSTLLRLLAGELRPTLGHVVRPSRLGYVPQSVTLATAASVAEVLGVDVHLRALRAIESGHGTAADFDALGDDWLVEERSLGVLASLGLDALDLDRVVGEVSGGEATLLAIGAALLSDPEVLLLDEPTNNLDAVARESLIAALGARSGATAIVTHDRALLAAVERIGELREREDRTTELRWFGGAIDAFEAAKVAERAAAEQAVVAASAHVARESRDLTAHRDAAARKARVGEKARAQRRVVGMAANAKRNQAERTDARVRAIHDERLESARTALNQAREAIPRDRSIRVDLPGTAVPGRREVLVAHELVTRTGPRVDASIVGAERIHLCGRNGSGKTTLIETFLGLVPAASGNATLHVPFGYLAQRLDVLDDGLSVVDNVRRRAPEASLQEVRHQLGTFQFRGLTADALAATLSGGERFRAALASVLLARPEPQLLVLDEPTNNLDFESQAQLIQALEGYRGALLVVSHDDAFVEAIRPTRRWQLSEGTLLDVPL
jgi:ATPase subunit of ABC transporter with duplicated ATPase domains